MKAVRIGCDIRFRFVLKLRGEVPELSELPITCDVVPSERIVENDVYGQPRMPMRGYERVVSNGSYGEREHVRPSMDDGRMPVRLPVIVQKETDPVTGAEETVLYAYWEGDKQFATGEYDVVLTGLKNRPGQCVADVYRTVRLVAHTAQADGKGSSDTEEVIEMEIVDIDFGDEEDRRAREQARQEAEAAREAAEAVREAHEADREKFSSRTYEWVNITKRFGDGEKAMGLIEAVSLVPDGSGAEPNMRGRGFVYTFKSADGGEGETDKWQQWQFVGQHADDVAEWTNQAMWHALTDEMIGTDNIIDKAVTAEKLSKAYMPYASGKGVPMYELLKEGIYVHCDYGREGMEVDDKDFWETFTVMVTNSEFALREGSWLVTQIAYSEKRAGRVWKRVCVSDDLKYPKEWVMGPEWVSLYVTDGSSIDTVEKLNEMLMPGTYENLFFAMRNGAPVKDTYPYYNLVVQKSRWAFGEGQYVDFVSQTMMPVNSEAGGTWWRSGYKRYDGTSITWETAWQKGAALPAGAISTSLLADGAVTAGKIADKAVSADKLQAGSVTLVKIADGAVSEGKIAAGAVTTAKIADKAVSADKLQAGSVTLAKIQDGAVSEGKIAAGAVTTAKIASAAVTAAKIEYGAVGENQIANGAVSATRIADGAVVTEKIADGAVTADKLANLSVRTEKLGQLSVTSEKLAQKAVKTINMADGAVTAAKIGANAVETAAIKDGAVTAGKIADGAVVLPIISTTYAELVAKKGSWVAGQWYRITDYECTTDDSTEHGVPQSHAFDIIVMALSASEMCEDAYAAKREGDTYYAHCDLSAWRLKYSLANDTVRFAWANTSGKGVIYYMKDDRMNECGYDFKNICFKRYEVSASDMYADWVGRNMAFTNTLEHCTVSGASRWCPTFSTQETGSTSICRDTSVMAFDSADGAQVTQNVIGAWEYKYATGMVKQRLNNIVMFGTETYGNVFESNCRYNTFGQQCYYNTLGAGFSSNTMGDGCKHNTIGNECRFNVWGNYCYSNKLGNDCCNNVWGGYCHSNVFGEYCQQNRFGHFCYYNVFGKNCRYVQTGNNREAPKNYFRNIEVAYGVNSVYLNTADEGSGQDYCQNYKIESGIEGGGGVTLLRGSGYQTTVAKNSAGVIKYFNVADFT